MLFKMRSVTPAKVPLSSRAQIERLDAGLRSVRGAQEIISMISSRRVVTKLVLGHNALGDDGCIVLFRFLGSSIGKKYRISEISLNSNEIGDKGLLAISEYLKGNEDLKELFLQNNAFTGDSSVVSAFTEALNTSRLELLSLTTNRTLSDQFIEAFLPSLNAPSLREMHLSAIGITRLSAPYIVEYLSTPDRCKLHSIRCNGNALGLRAVRAITRAIGRNNYALLTVELYANQLLEPDSDSHDDEPDSGEESISSPAAWPMCEMRLKRILMRNAHLKRETEAQALCLLRYARTLLLHTSIDFQRSTSKALHPPRCSDTCSCIPSSKSLAPKPTATTAEVLSFTSLPTEIQLYILSFFAPTLSPAQRIRIYRYASSPNTLPPLLPCLPSFGSVGGSGNTVCHPDPSSMQFGGGGKVWSTGGGCPGGQCMGTNNSVLCHRDKERMRWLDAVGCSAYEPQDRSAEITL